MSALGHVWTAPWQELSDIAAALVGCGHVSGLFVRPVRPLALMLCADRVPSKARIQRCDDPNGFSRSPVRPCLHYVVMSSPIPSTLRFSIVHAVASRDFTLLERPPFRFHAITLTRRCCRVGAVHSIKSGHSALDRDVCFNGVEQATGD